MARFDGYELKIYRNEAGNKNSLSSSYIHALLLDSRGQLWVGTNYGLNLYLPETDNFQRFFNNPVDAFSIGGNGVRALFEDSQKNIWVGHGESGLSKYSVDEGIFVSFKHHPDNPHSLSENSVYALAEEPSGVLWIGTNQSGLDRLVIDRAHSAKTAKFEHFTHNPSNQDSLSDNSIRSLYVDKLNVLWVGTKNGLNRFNKSSATFTRFNHRADDPSSLSFNFIQDMAEDSDGHFWVATSGAGLNLFDREKTNFSRYLHVPGDKSSLFNNNVRVLHLDSTGNFWMGHYAAGASMLGRYASAFKNIYHNPFRDDSLNYSEIVDVAEKENGDLWVGTPKGLNLLSRKNGSVKRFIHKEDDPHSINHGGVLKLLYDSKKRLWAGLWGGGVNRLDDGSDKFIRYTAKPNTNEGLYTDSVWGLMEDSSGRIWVGNHLGGLSYYDESSDAFVRIPPRSIDPNGLDCNSVFEIFEDSLKGLWVGCSNGLYLKKADQFHFQHFYHRENDNTSISANHIWTIYEDSDSNIWVGTQGGGVNRYNRKNNTFSSLRVSDGLADDLVTGILQDDMGYLWFATGNGLSRFDPRTSTFKTYNKLHGLPGNVFNRAAYLKSKYGELIFGGKDGLTIFNPRMLSHNDLPPPVEIIDFQLFNKSVELGHEGSPLKNSILETPKINLDFNQSSFSFKFVALNYRVTSMNTYAYKLEGFDQDWVHSGNRRWAYYTNLDPGEYIFKVKAANNEGVWNEDGRSIRLVINPPWWRTYWAYCLYVVSFIGLVFLITYSIYQRKAAEQERKINDRLREVDKVKDVFLANTSHELRTPLHGMIGLAESLANGVTGPLSDETKHYLQMIILSGRRLANLVNDILDFSKLRESKISLHKAPIDVCSLTDVVIALFEPMLRGRNLSIQNKIASNTAYVLADENRLQQILYNLIGNAVKFTDEGTIEIGASEDDELVKFWVKDSGIGIAEDKIDSIFQSFQQVEGGGNHGINGTGLGLTVTKQLVELHGGTIAVKSILGQGSTFSFTLEKAKAGLKPIEKASNSVAGGGLGERGRYVFESKSDELSSANEQSGLHILVVDDEPVNRLVLDGFLKINQYKITECASGSEALELLSKDNDIALVLLDVMMPQMNGFETCKRLRESYSSRELPVIFLTGKNQRQDLEAGFAAGGNDFLSKPIAKEELLLRVETHLKISRFKD